MSTLLKRRFVDQIKVLFGWEPSKPTKAEDISPAAQKIHFYKKGNRDLIAEKLHARAHAEIIARFGRFPHRNAALGRPSTADELQFLAQPGSSF